MNATSLLVATTRLVTAHGVGDARTLSDLYRLLPYLRQTLSCTVCGQLLREPCTPRHQQCQHHVCRACLGGRKNLKTTCPGCRDYQEYENNNQLRIELQCYRRVCEYIVLKPTYRQDISTGTPAAIGSITNNNTNNNGGMTGSGTAPIPTASYSAAAKGLLDLIEEGARFDDAAYRSNSGDMKSAYRMLPCVFTTHGKTPGPLGRPGAQQLQPVQQQQRLITAAPAGSMATGHRPTTGVVLNPLQTQLRQVRLQQHLQPIVSSSSSSGPLAHKYARPPLTVTNLATPRGPMPTAKAPIRTVPNGSSMYSVLHPGQNKITLKRDKDDRSLAPVRYQYSTIAGAPTVAMLQRSTPVVPQQSLSTTATATTAPISVQTGTGLAIGSPNHTPTNVSPSGAQKRRGCRCGNATPTPGKLTCCGQRCPCYVDAKACSGCKCRGCRNPHFADGQKCRPHIAELDGIEVPAENNDCGISLLGSGGANEAQPPPTSTAESTGQPAVSIGAKEPHPVEQPIESAEVCPLMDDIGVPEIALDTDRLLPFDTAVLHSDVILPEEPFVPLNPLPLRPAIYNNKTVPSGKPQANLMASKGVIVDSINLDDDDDDDDDGDDDADDGDEDDKDAKDDDEQETEQPGQFNSIAAPEMANYSMDGDYENDDYEDEDEADGKTDIVADINMNSSLESVGQPLMGRSATPFETPFDDFEELSQTKFNFDDSPSVAGPANLLATNGDDDVVNADGESDDYEDDGVEDDGVEDDGVQDDGVQDDDVEDDDVEDDDVEDDDVEDDDMNDVDFNMSDESSD